MNAEEKQAIREQFEEERMYGNEERLVKYIPRLLNALDERDREVELKESEYQSTINKLNKQTKLIRGYQDSLKIYIEENQRLRKALIEIDEVYEDTHREDVEKMTAIARQALAGEEK